MNKKQFITANAAAVIMVLLMTGAAEIFSEKELIFPEITALTIGAWVAPKQSWKTNRPMIFLLIAVNAVLGVLAVRYLPVHMLAKTALMLIICYGEMILCKTTFAPLISACILPVFLGTTSWIYPISAAAMAGIVAIVQLAFEKAGVHEKTEFTPEKHDLVTMLKRFGAAMILCALPVLSGEVFFAAPPLLVAFTELSDVKSKARGNTTKLGLLVFIAATAGAFSRYFLVEKFGLPMVVAALIGAGAVLLFENLWKLYFPPAGAIAILAMIINSDRLLIYPVEVTVGFIILAAAALILFKDKKPHDEEKLTC